MAPYDFSQEAKQADGELAGKPHDAPPLAFGTWVSVKDRLPDSCVEVLLWDGEMTKLGWLGKDGRWTEYDVTHWMPLPEPAKE